MEIFKLGGEIPNTNYIFLGNYIYQQNLCVEVVSLLLALKIRYPKRVTLLRGCHESRSMTTAYGFYDQCLVKYGTAKIYNTFSELFDYFPKTAVIENEIFCLHSGLSPSLDTLDDVLNLDRVGEIPKEGAFCDLTWSTPSDTKGWTITLDSCGFDFGKDVTELFLLKNDLNMIFRSRSWNLEGFNWTHDSKIATVYSTTNFRGLENKAAFCEVKDSLELNFVQFSSAPKVDQSREDMISFHNI